MSPQGNPPAPDPRVSTRALYLVKGARDRLQEAIGNVHLARCRRERALTPDDQRAADLNLTAASTGLDHVLEDLVSVLGTFSTDDSTNS